MNLTTTETRRVSDETLVEAIAIITSPVFGALVIANALGGYPNDTWQTIGTYTPRQIVDEIIARGINLDEVLASCSRILVVDTPVFHMILEYDPRPRCPLCERRHYINKSTGEPPSCGDAQRFKNPPNWRWTRGLQEAAL